MNYTKYPPPYRLKLSLLLSSEFPVFISTPRFLLRNRNVGDVYYPPLSHILSLEPLTDSDSSGTPTSEKNNETLPKIRRTLRLHLYLYCYNSKPFYKNRSPKRNDPVFDKFTEPYSNPERKCHFKSQVLMMANQNYKVYASIVKSQFSL